VVTSKKIWSSLLCSVVLNGFCAVVVGVFLPLHAQGVLQPILKWFNRVSHLLLLPGTRLFRLFTDLSNLHHISSAGWVKILFLNVIFFWLLAFVIFLLVTRLRRNHRYPLAEDDSGGTVKGLSRRNFLEKGALAAAGCMTGGLGYSFVIEPQWLVVTRQQILIRDLAKGLDGLRVVHLSDIHHGPWFSLESVRRMVEQSNRLNPDLIILTGDYVHKSPAYVQPVVSALRGLKPRIGTVGVLGNHDWYEGADLMRQEFHQAKIPLIDNTRLFVTENRLLQKQSAEGLCLAGVGDFWEGTVDLEGALGTVPNHIPRLLLSHNPDVAEQKSLIEGGYRVDLMACGHTHGGQVRTPWGPPIVPSKFGMKYSRGLAQGPVCPVFVSAGIGMTALPFRLGVPPEIVVLELKRA
jgi:uncharacterized protein